MVRNKFDADLGRLNNELINMGNMIEQAIEAAMDALVSQDAEKAKEIMAYDNEVNKQEREIENLCFKLLLQQQPVARDLRTISSALKMVSDMERIGDHAADISELAILMADRSYSEKIEDIKKMYKETIVMLIGSLEAFVERSEKKAREVIAHDDVVDKLFLAVKRDVLDMIHKEPENGEQAADLLIVAKYFERIGDHAANIAEWVIFSITGKHI